MSERYEYARIEDDTLTPGWSAVIHPNSIAVVIPERFWDTQRTRGTVENEIDSLAWTIRDGLRRQLIKDGSVDDIGGKRLRESTGIAVYDETYFDEETGEPYTVRRTQICPPINQK